MLQVGDKIRVRRLKDLACEYIDIKMYDGIEMFGKEGVLIAKGNFFVDAMCKYCGEEHEVICRCPSISDFEAFYIDETYNFNFNTYMLERLDGSLIAEN